MSIHLETTIVLTPSDATDWANLLAYVNSLTPNMPPSAERGDKPLKREITVRVPEPYTLPALLV